MFKFDLRGKAARLRVEHGTGEEFVEIWVNECFFVLTVDDALKFCNKLLEQIKIENGK